MKTIKIFLACLILIIGYLQFPVLAEEVGQLEVEKIKHKKFDAEVKQALASDNSYLKALIRKANEKQLFAQKKWQMLLHYKENFFGGVTSEVDGNDFFTSSSGKHDPKAELEATLASFFSNEEHPYIKLTPQCRFVARFYWLNQELTFDPNQLAIQSCPKYSDFKNGVNAKAITIIFPSAHPHGPASMFGHTSLKIDKHSQTPETRMLDYTLNFAAITGPDRGIAYALGGLSGGFKGNILYCLITVKFGNMRKWKAGIYGNTLSIFHSNKSTLLLCMPTN